MTDREEKKLRELVRVFLEENKKVNLSAYRTEEQCWHGNILDSVSVVGALRAMPLRGAAVVDVGMGGGFPLLPLAILIPDARFTGFDAVRKKVEAVRRIVETLGLRNVDLLAGRAEELGRDPKFREQFDMVLGRAIAPLPTLLEYLSPFAKVGGTLFCWKSLDIEKELLASVTARLQLKCRLMERHGYDLPGDWGRRQILEFKKTAALPEEFPRGVGVPKKKPL